MATDATAPSARSAMPPGVGGCTRAHMCVSDAAALFLACACGSGARRDDAADATGAQARAWPAQATANTATDRTVPRLFISIQRHTLGVPTDADRATATAQRGVETCV